MLTVVHEFNASLQKSKTRLSDDLVNRIYHSLIKEDIQCICDMSHDGDHQRKGVDRLIVLKNSKVLTFDEKVRETVYWTDLNKTDYDISLEYISVDKTNKVGWVNNSNITADYINYIVYDSEQNRYICVLLPTIQLRLAWQQYGDYWLKTYRKNYHVANNKDYKTLFCPVPRNVVMRAIGENLRGEIL